MTEILVITKISVMTNYFQSPFQFSHYFGHTTYFQSLLKMWSSCNAGDDFFQWLLLQVHTKDQHAITMDGFRVIYNEKLPSLRPETITMLGLNLFSQLWQLAR